MQIWRSDGWIEPLHLALSLAIFILPSLAILVLAYRRSPAFIRWRATCVIAVRLARGALGLVAYNRDFAHTVVLPSSPGRLVGHLLRWVRALGAARCCCVPCPSRCLLG